MQTVKFILLSIALLVAWIFLIPGAIWSLFFYEKVGYRKIDVLMMFVPFWSFVVFARTTWRYAGLSS